MGNYDPVDVRTAFITNVTFVVVYDFMIMILQDRSENLYALCRQC